MSFRSSTFSPDYRCPTAGSAATSVLSHEEARQLFQRTQQRWSQTNDQLTSAIRERTTSPLSPFDGRQKDQEIVHLRNELLVIQAQMEQCKQQLQYAEATIRQQQATIRNQSKAIENPRLQRDAPPTPQHHNRGHQSLGSTQIQHELAPAFGFQSQRISDGQQQPLRSLYGPVAPPTTNPIFNSSSNSSRDFLPSRLTGQTPEPVAVQGTSRVNSYGSPAQYRPLVTGPSTFHHGPISHNMTFPYHWNNNTSAPSGPVQPPSMSSNSAYDNQQTSSTNSFASPQSFRSNPYPEPPNNQATGPLILATDANHEASIKASFQRVFDLAQEYAAKHANIVSTSGDYAMPQEHKDRLLNASSKTTAFSLMSDRNTRYLLVSKIMIQWILKHILKYNTFSGLDTKIDQVINGAKATIYQSTPAALRFLLLTNIAHEFKKLRDKLDFAAYVYHLSRQRAPQLLQVVRPMMHQQPVGELEDLVILLEESYRLAEVMFAGTDEFSFDFPTFSLKFDPNTMINVDPHLGGYGVADLMRAQAAVKLGATPIVRVRKNVAQGEVHAHVLLKAKVVLKRLN